MHIVARSDFETDKRKAEVANRRSAPGWVFAIVWAVDWAFLEATGTSKRMNASAEVLRNYEIFRDMDDSHLVFLAAGAVERQFADGEVLFREGEPADRFYLIESGRIALEAQRPSEGVSFIQALDTGEAVGWAWLFPPFRWHFQARAVRPSRVIVLDGARLLAEAEKNHDFGYQLLKCVTEMVIRRLNTTRRQLLASQAGAGFESQIV